MDAKFLMVFLMAEFFLCINALPPKSFYQGLRLVGGNWKGEGRVEIFHKGNWGTVCDDGWDMKDALVVCRQLGFPFAASAPGSAHFGAGSGRIWLDDVYCSGIESSIADCPHRGWGVGDCDHSEDASVICSGYGRRYQYDSKAFLFSLVNKPGWAPVKLPQTGKYGSSRTSLYFHYSYGPTFGAGHDIYLSNYASFGTNSYSNLGYTYYDPTGGNSYGTTFTQTFLAGSYRFTPDEIETFYETT